jgi:type IV pilus assembly protein PilZ
MSTEKRSVSRASIEVRVEYRTVGSFLSDWSVNISQGGLFIQTKNPLKEGTSVRLVFSLPGIPLLFDLNGEVKWTQEVPSEQQPFAGMGVEFVDLDDRIRDRIENYVKRISEEMPKSLQPGKPSKPTVEVKRTSGSSPEREEVTQPNARISDPGKKST